MSWMTDKSLKVIEKLRDERVFVKWVDATFPVMGNFLSSCGWDGRIVVRNEAGAVLHQIEPRNQAQTAKELNLVRADDYKFRLQSSSTFEDGFGWATLFKSLAAQLEGDGAGKQGVLDLVYLVYNFDYFTTSEKDSRSGENREGNPWRVIAMSEASEALPVRWRENRSICSFVEFVVVVSSNRKGRRWINIPDQLFFVLCQSYGLRDVKRMCLFGVVRFQFSSFSRTSFQPPTPANAI